MFEEFGLELPIITKLAMVTSDRLLTLWFVLLPVAAVLTLGVEAVLLSMPVGSNRRILNWIYWIVFLILVGFFVSAFAQPTIAILLFERLSVPQMCRYL